METDYFPELKDYKSRYDKWGINNLALVKDKNVLGGLTWRYTYYDLYEDKIKHISSYDIRKLRRKVENQGLNWVITDLEKARETYKLNSKLLVEHEKLKEEKNKNRVAEHTISKSGVQYVYMNNTNNTVYWTYRDKKHQSLTRRYLKDLKQVVLEKGYDWIVKDNELYDAIVKVEQEEYE